METHRQLLRYAVIGLASNALGYVGYLLLSSFGMGHKTALTALYGVGVLQTFVFNRRWTFRYAGAIPGSIARYIAIYAFGYVFAMVAMYLLVDLFGLPHKAVVLALIFVVACGIFLLQKFWAFPVMDQSPPSGYRE